MPLCWADSSWNENEDGLRSRSEGCKSHLHRVMGFLVVHRDSQLTGHRQDPPVHCVAKCGHWAKFRFMRQDKRKTHIFGGTTLRDGHSPPRPFLCPRPFMWIYWFIIKYDQKDGIVLGQGQQTYPTEDQRGST